MKNPVHPGEVLKHDFLEEFGLSEGKFAKHIGVPRTRIERICRGETSISVDTALRLSKALGTSVQFWMNLQNAYDLVNAAAEVDVSDIEPLAAA
jgi:addiction module HigA family antidote